MIIQKMYLTPNQYSRPQTKLSKVTKIAIHYVGNANSSAIANRNYFESLKDKKIYASSHYIVGLQGEIIQCIPENEISYCTNQANNFSISIETCHPDTTGKFTDITNKSLIELCADICKRYNLDPIVDMIRHYDVTGKKCPLYHVNNPNVWNQLKSDVLNYMKADDDMTPYEKMAEELKILKENLEKMELENFTKLYNEVMTQKSGDNPSEWAKEATESAKKAGIFKGDGQGNYNWQQPLTRQEAAVILYNLKLFK